MNLKLKSALGASLLLLSAHAAAQVTFYEGEGFTGRAFTTAREVRNFERAGFNDRASSVVVDRGSWEVCDDAGFRGHCVVLRRGSYESLRGMNMQDRISSLRPVANRRYDNEAPAPLAQPTYEYRRRPNERIFQAPVVSVRAVLGPPEQRCWLERSEVSRGNPNVGGAIAGALIGGVLGHQVGSGRGNDVATAGGAVAGAAVGSNMGRDGNAYGSDVRRCETVSSGPPDHYDVVYRHAGVDHRIQMRTPPGETVSVNRNGEPRG
ncbi:MAG TPA: beta/gamma crystallin-related protein [Usitatibacter sp.]|nr:beta/gamma crystallin-related protein [Usitatibacter sp.]